MKEEVTWEEVELGCQKIAKFLKLTKMKIKNIYGIPRGGLIPAVRLSHLLNKPLIIREEEISKETLIVDEIVDTGKTVKKYLENGYTVVSLFYNISKSKPPMYWVFVKEDKWIVFPWE